MRTRLISLGQCREEKSKAIVAALARHPAFNRGNFIALYSPLPSEPDVEPLWDKVSGPFCYPRVADGSMQFVHVEKIEHLITSPWHPQIREHGLAEARVVSPAEIGAILVPGLAFTKRGHRLGRGGGYYDRYLAALPATSFKVGVCFAMQLVESMPMEAHDRQMDAIATEEGLEIPEPSGD